MSDPESASSQLDTGEMNYGELYLKMCRNINMTFLTSPEKSERFEAKRKERFRASETRFNKVVREFREIEYKFSDNHPNYKKAEKHERASALQRCIEAVPTDGLGITKSDFEQIGVTDYRAADLLLIEHLKGATRDENHPTIVKHRQTAFKRLDPQNIPRKTLFK